MTFIRQCPDCKVITDDIGKGRARRVPSIVILKQLEQVICFICSKKKEEEKIITNEKDNGKN